VALSYALITPARDEAENLRRLAGCLSTQSVAPTAWIVVDNGSGAETHLVLEQLAAEHPWFRWIVSPPTARPLPGAPIVRAFHRGLEEIAADVDVVVKLDADVSFAPDHFERLLQAFEDDLGLGIAGSTCLELENGDWRPIHVTGDHVRGAVRAYRRACLDAVVPLPECVGWDGVDELKAQVLGWRTGLVPGLSFRHHRKLGERDAGRHARWVAQGRGAHFMGYRPLYLLLRVAHHVRRDRGALGMVWGYALATARREPVYEDRLVREHLRSTQSLRRLHVRAREALGRRRVD
jgi:poly-beta-1,6-N-acetyl-D-glucosamine synthase